MVTKAKNLVYTSKEVRDSIEEFEKSLKKKNHRYRSFDFCYHYFQTNQKDLTANMETSCMVLWSYLTSWGMLRNSKLLQKNYSVLKPVIKAIQTIFNEGNGNHNIEKDKDKYCKKVVNLYNGIYQSLPKYLNASETLVTKIILGVFGAFPALDQYFRKTFGYSEIETIAGRVWEFYRQHQPYYNVINTFKIPVKSFNVQPTGLYYPVAKLIDMFGFTYGMGKSNQPKHAKKLRGSALKKHNKSVNYEKVKGKKEVEC